MAFYIKSTVYNRQFKMVASSDHISKKTAASPVVNISKNGGAFGAAAGAVTEISNGWYQVALTSADTGTAGDLSFYITGTAADDTDFVDQVVDPAVANLGVNVVNWLGTVVATPATAGIPDINVKNIVNTAAAVDANNLLKVDVEDWKAGVVPAVSITGVPKVDLQDILGTVVATPATAGILDVNVKNMNNVSGAAITTIKAVQGLTTADTVVTVSGNVNGSVGSVTGAVGSVTARVTANTDQWAGGTIPAVNVTGVPLVDLKYTLGTISPATAGSVRADAVTGAVGSVTGAVGSVTGAVGSVTGAVGSVTGNVGGNVVGSVASVTAAVTITSNIKKNQALAKFQFLMTDSTTHAPKTGLSPTCTRSIDGGAFAAGTLANIAELSNGTYLVDFGAGDLNGNVIVLRATGASADDTFERIVTQL